MNAPDPRRRHDRHGARLRAAVCLAVWLAVGGAGCVSHGGFTTRRAVLERHPLGKKQAVLTVVGQPPPPAREVRRYRLNHGAPRRHVPLGRACPWWPGLRDRVTGAARDGADRAADALDGLDGLDDLCPPGVRRRNECAPPPFAGAEI